MTGARTEDGKRLSHAARKRGRGSSGCALALFGEHASTVSRPATLPPRPAARAVVAGVLSLTRKAPLRGFSRRIQASAINSVGPWRWTTSYGCSRPRRATVRLIDGYCAVLESFVISYSPPPTRPARTFHQAPNHAEMKSALMPKSDRRRPGSPPAGSGHRRHGRPVRRVDVGGKSRMTGSREINGELLNFDFSRDHLDYILGYNEITGDRLAMLKRIVRRQTTLVFKGLKRPSKPQRRPRQTNARPAVGWKRLRSTIAPASAPSRLSAGPFQLERASRLKFI